MTKLDEPCRSSFLFRGKISFQKQSQDSEHVHIGDSDTDLLSHNKLVEEQENDPELKDLFERALTLQEVKEVHVCFCEQNGVLIRKWKPLDTRDGK